MSDADVVDLIAAAGRAQLDIGSDEGCEGCDGNNETPPIDVVTTTPTAGNKHGKKHNFFILPVYSN